MVGSEMQEQAGTLQTVQERLNIRNMVDRVYESKDLIIEIGLYACIGFFTGYLLKRYSGIIALLIFFIAGLAVLHQIELVSVAINWNSIYEFFGIQPALVATESLGTIAWEWMRANVVITISAIIGFLIGLRIG